MTRRFSDGNGELVHALRFKGDFGELEAFVGGDAEFRANVNKTVVATPRGALWVGAHEWVVRNEGGAFSVWDDDAFHAEYEEVIP